MSGHWRQNRSFRIVLAAMLAVVGSTGLITSPAHAATTPAVVSLTFDDGQASQSATMTMLQSRGMVGTYYINSAMVGSSSYYMNWTQIHDIANAGNEIGGHTLHHTNLTTVSTSTATTEVCDDRTNLLGQGFAPVASFAYPEAAVNSTAETIVKNCGYTNGRGVGDAACGGCVNAETIPPVDPYRLRTPDGVTTSTTLATMQSWVVNAENNGGGWIILTFHGICDNQCTSTNSMTVSTFTAFLDWLRQHNSATGTVVRTVGDVMGTPPPPPGPDTTAPTTSIACSPGGCSSWSRTPVTVTLSAVDSGGSGVDRTVYTTNGSDPAVSGSTYTGPFAVAQTATVRYYSIDKAGNVEPAKSQQVQIDTVAPSVAVTNPAAGAQFQRGTVVALQAAASDTGSGVARVVFAMDGTQLGTDTTAPYQYSWNTRKASWGQHNLTAIAYDVAGNSTTSPAVPMSITK
jgi:peptidoglycan/xylan/chitin deacetylase (PgdA/CDA1 family)